jgi:Uma2 family endonuclease
MAMLETRPKKTVADYMALPDEPRMELFDGELFMSPSPNDRHQIAVLNLGTALRRFVKDRGLGEVFVAPFDCILSDDVVVQPDVLFVTTASLGRIRERLHGPPDLAIEVLSRGHAERDRIVKRDLYARHGVREFWIVDPDAHTIEVMTQEGAGWKFAGLFSGDEPVRSPLLPGLDLRTAAAFE